MRINNKGNPSNKIWFVVENPYEKDSGKGYLFSDTMGWIFDKIITEAGLSLSDTYITSLKPDLTSPLSDEDAILQFKSDAEKEKPPIIVPLGWGAAGILCPETISNRGKFKRAALDKYSGSLLVSPHLDYPHYCIPSYAPDYICADWGYREVQVFIDFGHVREEYEYYKKFGALNPRPSYNLVVEPTFDVLMDTLEGFRQGYARGNISYLSTDIETIRPIKSSEFKGNPGYPYTNSFASNSTSAISFSFWDYDGLSGVLLWRLLDDIFANVPQIYQNGFNFDLHYLDALGFKRICREKCQDTLIRHHILWPELEHKLQFQTRQYTRQPYYKDEGKGWSPKYKHKLMRYNALDAVITYAIWEAQEEEFKLRPHLK